MLPDKDAKARGEPRLLAVDERMVVPVNATVKMIVTSDDVIHSWGIPAFWVKMDAVPGRLNETWFKAERPGLYYGQCFELCGARHAYMPIAVEVVTPGAVRRLGRLEGRNDAGRGQPASPDATANSPVTNPTAAPAGRRRRPRRPTNPAHAGTAAPPVTNQASNPAAETEIMTDTTANASHFEAGHARRTPITTPTTSRASSPAGSCPPTTRTSARSI